MLSMIGLTLDRHGTEEVDRESGRRFHGIANSADELRYRSGPGADYPSYVTPAEQLLAEA